MGKNGPNISQNAHDLARKEKVDVGQIEGTGTGGQITVTDVKKHLADQKAGQSTTPKPAVSEAEAKAPSSEEASGDGSGAEASERVTPPPTQTPPSGPPPVEPTPGVPPADELEEGRKPIERINQTTGTWWCPFCGRSMAHDLEDCGGCGAVRDGEEAVRS